jgi:Co/Zn/Cd efflux system component
MSDSCCGCGQSIDVEAMHAKQRRVLTIVLAINAATFLMMVGAALHSRSSSLLSGGLDNLGDALTYALSLAVVGAGTRAKGQVAPFKGGLIFAAAVAVGIQIAWRVANPTVPLFEGMGAAAFLNLIANLVCLRLLTPYREGDVNMSSAWECSRNDVFEGLAVLGAAAAVWMFDSGWPDIIIAAALLVMFLRSAGRVFRTSFREIVREPLGRFWAGVIGRTVARQAPWADMTPCRRNRTRSNRRAWA